MRKFFQIAAIVFSICFLAFQSRAGQKPLSLTESFQLALQRSESIEISKEDINFEKARFQEILGHVTPRVSFVSSEYLQERVVSPFSNSFNRASSFASAFTLSQPIFHGFIDFYALRGSKFDLAQKEFLQREAERRLYQDVAATFFLIASLDRNIRTTNLIRSVLIEQMVEMEKWKNIGKMRESELAALKAEVALLEANIAKYKGDKKIAKEIMSYLTGVDPFPEINFSGNYKKVKKLDEYVAAVTQRPDVLASKKEVQSSNEKIKMAKGMLVPGIDLNSNFYPYRQGIGSDINWDVQFTLDLPIFNLSNIAKVKEAKILSKQSKLVAQKKEREALLEVKKTYAAFQSAHLQLNQYQKAVNLAEQSYKLQREDYRNGLVSYMDLLQSERTWFDSLKQRDVSEVETWMQWINLQTSSGMIP